MDRGRSSSLSETPSERRAFARAVVLPILISLFGVGAFVVGSLAIADWDPTILVAVGEYSGPTREFAEEHLGEIYLTPQLGHDGKFFFVQANDPWVLDPETNALVLDRPLYRSQRMFYPVLAGGAGLFTPQQIVWAMVAVNIVAMGLGTLATSAVAAKMGLSVFWGLAFAFNLGFLMEVSIGGAGVVAGALAFGAAALIQRGRLSWAVALLVLAVLAREAMVLTAIGCAYWLWTRKGDRKHAVLAVSLPMGAAALWAIYLRMRIVWESGAGQIQEIGVPFGGFIEAVGSWVAGDLLSLATGFVILLILLAFVVRALRSPELVGWAFLLFALLGMMFTEQVWRSYFDIARAVAPALTAYVLLIASSRLARATGVEAG